VLILSVFCAAAAPKSVDVQALLSFADQFSKAAGGPLGTEASQVVKDVEVDVSGGWTNPVFLFQTFKDVVILCAALYAAWKSYGVAVAQQAAHSTLLQTVKDEVHTLSTGIAAVVNKPH